jgi:hypothetical protein
MARDRHACVNHRPAMASEPTCGLHYPPCSLLTPKFQPPQAIALQLHPRLMTRTCVSSLLLFLSESCHHVPCAQQSAVSGTLEHLGDLSMPRGAVERDYQSSMRHQTIYDVALYAVHCQDW